MARRWPLGTGGLERCSRASDARRYMDAAGVCGRGLLLQVLRFSQDLSLSTLSTSCWTGTPDHGGSLTFALFPLSPLAERSLRPTTPCS